MIGVPRERRDRGWYVVRSSARRSSPRGAWTCSREPLPGEAVVSDKSRLSPDGFEGGMPRQRGSLQLCLYLIQQTCYPKRNAKKPREAAETDAPGFVDDVSGDVRATAEDLGLDR
jgi:hypothetical protein